MNTGKFLTTFLILREENTMLEFYRKHYMTNNRIINILDIVFAIFVTFIVFYSFDQEMFKLQILLIVVVWVRAILTLICMVKYRKGSKAE